VFLVIIVFGASGKPDTFFMLRLLRIGSFYWSAFLSIFAIAW